MKGVDAVRRDRSKLVKTLSEGILDALLIQKDLKKAVQQIKDTVDAVARQKAPLEWFILSKSLKSTYASENQPHVQAWRRMQARGDADVPEIGTRMPYVIVVGKGRDGPLYERTEHPEYVRLKKIKYCAKYYLENAKDVVVRLLGPTGQGPAISQLFSDAIVTADTVASGNMSLMAFKRAKY
jgi:DNA polymerase elongation subunit (family B)